MHFLELWLESRSHADEYIIAFGFEQRSRFPAEFLRKCSLSSMHKFSFNVVWSKTFIITWHSLYHLANKMDCQVRSHRHQILRFDPKPIRGKTAGARGTEQVEEYVHRNFIKIGRILSEKVFSVSLGTSARNRRSPHFQERNNGLPKDRLDPRRRLKVRFARTDWARKRNGLAVAKSLEGREKK